MLLLASAEGAWDLVAEEPLSPEAENELARLKPEEVGQRIGQYKLREQLGEGGFGTVWVADQEHPVRRRVALKIIKLGMDTKEVVARFEQERQALAMMDHPNIAKVLDAGATEWGRPFFVMELVRGIRITDYCDQENLPTVERLKLFLAVCNAVQHAHQKGIIHRDLKPSNILVTLHDGVPVPKVIDFGVAKATQGRLTDLTIYTQFQQLIGTPLYMSPEQAEMSGLDVDTRSDIYALGILLYELLTGRTPISPGTLCRMGLDEIRRIIREQDAPRPSTALHAMALNDRTIVAHRRRSEPPKLIGQIRGDLDCIVMKALEKDRTRRYESASGLAMDVERHLAHEPVLARPTSAFYRFRRAARRNKGLFISVAAIFSAVLIGGTVAGWQALVADRRLNELRATAPMFAALSKRLVAEGEFNEAIETINSALWLDPSNAEYLMHRAHLLQAMQKLVEAEETYRHVLRLREDASARLNLALCETILARNGEDRPLSDESQRQLVDSLLKQGRHFDAAPLAKLIGRDSEIALPMIKDRLKQLATLPQWDWNVRVRLTRNGTYALDLGDLPINVLPNLDGLPISELHLSNTLIFDLAPLRALRLSVLDLNGTLVADLSPLQGMPLTTLMLDRTRVTDLKPVAGAPLEWLQIWDTRITDLRPLAGMPIKHLQIGETSIDDLSPLRGVPLEALHAIRIQARDFSPLANSPLQTLRVDAGRIDNLDFVRTLSLKSIHLYECRELKDFRPLADCRSLEEIGLCATDQDLSFLKSLPQLKRVGFEDGLLPPKAFWTRLETARAKR
jgi:serine/threonine protein kinase